MYDQSQVRLRYLVLVKLVDAAPALHQRAAVPPAMPQQSVAMQQQVSPAMTQQAAQAALAALSQLLTASVPLLPSGWQMARDPASGKFYFYNMTTGVVQWELPVVCGTGAGSAGASSGTSQQPHIVSDSD